MMWSVRRGDTETPAARSGALMESAARGAVAAINRPAVHTTGIAGGPQPKACSLDKALAYRNDQILYKFQEHWDVSFDEASELFEETKKWLWLQVIARQQAGSPPLAMTVSLAMVDEMLHTFILFTKEYVQYCEQNYGVYLHHTPMTKKQKDAKIARFRREPKALLAEEAEFLSDMYFFVYEWLGRETVVKWYSEYANKYSGARMAELAKADGRRFANVQTAAPDAIRLSTA
jgi:hypothetical protein